MMPEFNSELKALLKERGLTQKWLAEKTGMALPTINQYCRGVRTPRMYAVIAISNALGISVNQLFGTKDTSEMLPDVTIEQGVTIADRLKKLRNRCGATQKEIATACGWKESQYRAYELGRIEPSSGSLIRLSMALKSSPNEILGWEGNSDGA